MELRQAFDAIYSLHQKEGTVLLANGLLEIIRRDEEFKASLINGELAFYEMSKKKNDDEIQLALGSLEEGNEALIKAEQRAAELTREKKKSEDLAMRLEADRDDLINELEQSAMLHLQYKRMDWQFKTFGLNAPWAWGILCIFLLGIFMLIFMDKKGTEVLIPVLATVLGAAYGAFGQSMSSLYANMVKEEHGKSKRSYKRNLDDK